MEIPTSKKNIVKYKDVLDGQIYYLYEQPSRPIRKGEEGFFKPYPDREVYLNPQQIYPEYEEDHNG